MAPFKNNKNNEAFIDRIYVIKVPYVLRVQEEQRIYEKLIRGSELSERRARRGRSKCWRAAGARAAVEGARELKRVREDARL
ncbi:MAG: hypothetical protein R3C30_02725 [Hyphomonadaceae bacterium]